MDLITLALAKQYADQVAATGGGDGANLNAASLGGESAAQWQSKLDDIKESAWNFSIGTQGAQYRIFARFNVTANNECETILVSGGGNYGSDGDLWAITMRGRPDGINVKVNALMQVSRSDNPAFGYYTDGDYMYIGVYVPSAYASRTYITRLKDNGEYAGVYSIEYDVYYIGTTQPTGWTTVETTSLYTQTKRSKGLDFNDIIDTGIYSTGGAIPSDNGNSNYPTDITGTLIVESSTYCYNQTYITHEGVIYTRSKYYGSNFSWSKWEKSLSTSGGTVTGDLYLQGNTYFQGNATVNGILNNAGIKTRVFNVPDNGGRAKFLLMFDITYWCTADTATTGLKTSSFTGTVFSHRGGGNFVENVVDVAMGVSYQRPTYKIFKSSSANYIPYILHDSVNEKYYLALRCTSSGRAIRLQGIYDGTSLAETWVNCTDSSGTLPDGWSIVEDYQPSYFTTHTEAITAEGDITVYKNSHSRVILDNTSVDRVIRIQDTYDAQSNVVAYIGNISRDDTSNLHGLIIRPETVDVADAIALRRSAGGITSYYNILHSGNFADYTVYHGASAPTSTTCIWVDTANKVIKAYIDGAWTQVS